MGANIKVTLNGTACEFPHGATVLDILEHKKVEPQRVVVELNRTIISSSDFATTQLSQDDTIEVLRFVGGG